MLFFAGDAAGRFAKSIGVPPLFGMLIMGLIVQFLPDSPERRRIADLDPGDAPEGAQIAAFAEDDFWAEARGWRGVGEWQEDWGELNAGAAGYSPPDACTTKTCAGAATLGARCGE